MNIHPKLKKLPTPVKVPKKWGYELILFNNEELCGKILHFHKGSKFSGHLHQLKFELFFVNFGKLIVEGVNTEDASKYQIELNPGDVLEVPRLAIHQITALEESEITEFSTTDYSSDSYRYFPGDSQKI